MSAPDQMLGAFFGDAARIALDRAQAEMRSGRPIILDGGDERLAVITLDSTTPNGLDRIAALPGAALILSAETLRHRGPPVPIRRLRFRSPGSAMTRSCSSPSSRIAKCPTRGTGLRSPRRRP